MSDANKDSAADNVASNSSGSVEGSTPIKSSTYRDFSRVTAERHSDASTLIAQSTTAKEPTFPVKLHMILSNPEFQDIIAWLPHGRSWRILQQKAFEERVIPLYFRHGRYSSFARQVNGWGFKRITHGSDYNSYYHELFLRGMPHLCDKMRRLTTKDLSKKKMEDGPTPDFYALSRENPLPESTPIPISTLTPPAMAAGRAGSDLANADVELALLERRRADIFNRMNLLASNNGGINMNAMNGINGMQAMQQLNMQQQMQQMQNMQQGGFDGINGGGGGPAAANGGQQDANLQQMNNNSLMQAALSLGNGASGQSGLNPAVFQQQMLGGMGNLGQMFGGQNPALQRQLLEARFGGADMAALLGLSNGGSMQMQNNNGAMNGMAGFMGMHHQP